jgi:hypothetical protein
MPLAGALHTFLAPEVLDVSRRQATEWSAARGFTT